MKHQAQKRIYIVSSSAGDRLVEAQNKSQMILPLIGENWVHKKTKKLCIIQNNSEGIWDFVKLRHMSKTMSLGRISQKRVRAFLAEYEKVKSE